MKACWHVLEDRRWSPGGEDGGRSRELRQQFSVLHYVVLVHNFVNKMYITVLQLLVKLRPISSTSFGHESDSLEGPTNGKIVLQLQTAHMQTLWQVSH